jgi:hypothetical protein
MGVTVNHEGYWVSGTKTAKITGNSRINLNS